MCTFYKTPATWSNVSLTHRQAYHKTSSTKQLFNEETSNVQACRHNYITLNTCLTKTGFFQSQHTTQLTLFNSTDSLSRKTRCFASFPSQLFKANKVKGQGTLNRHTIFESIPMLSAKNNQN